MPNYAFTRYHDLNESNFLTPRVDSLAENVPHQPFKDAIGTLAVIRKPLKVLQTTSRLSEVSYWQHYLDALRWLNGETALSTPWVSLPQIEDYRSIDETTAVNFNTMAANLGGALNGQTAYQQAQMYVGAVESKLVDDMIHSRIEPLESEFQQTLSGETSKAIETINTAGSTVQTNITSTGTTQVSAIENTKNSAIAEFQQARALANWSTYYGTRVEEYDELLFGEHWPKDGVKRKWENYRESRSLLPKQKFWDWHIPALWLFTTGASRCIAKAIRVFAHKAFSYNGKRVFWFGAFVIAVIVLIITNAASIYGVHSLLGVDPTKLRPTHNDTLLFAKVSIYIAIFAIPLFGYSFANKNYRIYSNLLEQYRHREVVAKTIQGILAQPSNDDSTDVRKELANVAAVALFEQKTIGHLTKNEASSPSILDIVKTFRP